MNGQLDGIADEMLQAAGGRRQVVIVFIANPLERHLNARQDLWLPVVAGEGRKCVNAAAHAHN